MKNNFMTCHAALRSQQRAIPQLIIDWLMDYGAVAVDQRGAEIFYFDHAARRRLSKAVGERAVSLLGRLLDAYVVFSERGTVITVGHRYKRVVRS